MTASELIFANKVVVVGKVYVTMCKVKNMTTQSHVTRE